MTWTTLLPLLQIGLSFVVMLLCLRLKRGVGLSILAGSLALALLFGHGPIFWLEWALEGVLGTQTLLLGAIVTTILLFSDLFEETGQARTLLQAMGGLRKRPRLALAFFPALIGLLPMPGGAGFSAPMVNELGDPMGVPAEDKTLVNYWFRHIWELAWPLYPGVLLASALAGTPVMALSLASLPSCALCVYLGWHFFLRPKALAVNGVGRDGETPLVIDWPAAWRAGLPLAVAIGGAICLELLAALLPELPEEVAVLTALVLAIGCLARQRSMGWAQVLRPLRKAHLPSMLAVVAAVFVYKSVLEGVEAIPALAGLGQGGAALFLAAVIPPFVVGVVSGITMAFVGATFPLLLGMLEQAGMAEARLAYLVLGLCSGFAGIMISPIHLCFMLSCQYFRAEIMPTWRRLVRPCAVLLGWGMVWFLVLRLVL